MKARHIVFLLPLVAGAVGACGGHQADVPVAAAPSVGDVVAAQPLGRSSGWILSTQNGLETTADGGKRFNRHSPSGVPASAVAAVQFQNESTGWIVSGPADTALQVRSTADGGKSWRVVGSVPVEPNSGGGPIDLKFVDTSTGFILRSLPSSAASDQGQLAATSDGGTSWTKRDVPFFGKLTALDGSHIVITGGPTGNALAVSDDAGRTWKDPIGFPRRSPDTEIVAVAAAAPSIRVLMSRLDGETGGVSLVGYVSKDNGASWTGDGVTGTVTAPTELVPAGSLPDGSWIVASPDGSRIWKSEGRKFTAFEAKGLAGTVLELTAGDAGVIWARSVQSSCGGFKTDCASSGQLFVSSDGGATWSQSVSAD